jgi:hypothetical protein
MGVITPTVTTYDKRGWGTQQAFLVEWKTITQGDTCARIIMPAQNAGIVSVGGTLNGGTIALHGSNNPTDTDFLVLLDITETALTGLGLSHRQVLDHPLAYKPILTGGGGSTDIDVRLLLYGRS